MNIQIKVSDLVYMLDANMVVEQVARAIQGAAAQANLVMSAPEAGFGYLVWRLPGDGWVSFSDLSDNDKTGKAALLSDRIERLKSAIGNPSIADQIAHVPDMKYVFFRSSGDSVECALVGWAYRYPESRSGDELEAWVNRVRRQNVSLAFDWDGKHLPAQPFTIQSVKHKTGDDGAFTVGSVPVGSVYTVVHTPTGRSFKLEVEEGRDLYAFDLTVTMTVDVAVWTDGEPTKDARVEVSFNGKSVLLVTDSTGHASACLALASDGMGSALAQQPDCSATFDGERQTRMPGEQSGMLEFVFNRETEKPLPEPLPEPEPAPEPEPEEPRFITIEITDVLETPVANLPVVFSCKKHKNQQLVTDSMGRFDIPADWLGKDDKFTINFQMTPEYRQTHNMVLDLKMRKKEKK